MLKCIKYILLLLIFTIFSSYCQIIDVIHDQPWPIKIGSLGMCCNDSSSLSTSFSLLDCVKKSITQLNNNNVKTSPDNVLLLSSAVNGIGNNAYVSLSILVLILTIGDYGIKDINDFSVYQSACIASYAMHNGYKLKLFDDSNSNYEPTDARWNKGI